MHRLMGMLRKCYVCIDPCLESETQRPLNTTGTPVPIQDIPGRDNWQPNILAPARGQQFLRYINSFTFLSPKLQVLFSVWLHLNTSEECQYF